MTSDELRADYTRAIKSIRAEKRAREWVFRNDPTRRAAKVAEMDELERIVTAFKDELKARLAASHEQPVLLDVPRRAEYR